MDSSLQRLEKWPMTPLSIKRGSPIISSSLEITFRDEEAFSLVSAEGRNAFFLGLYAGASKRVRPIESSIIDHPASSRTVKYGRKSVRFEPVLIFLTIVAMLYNRFVFKLLSEIPIHNLLTVKETAEYPTIPPNCLLSRAPRRDSIHPNRRSLAYQEICSGPRGLWQDKQDQPTVLVVDDDLGLQNPFEHF
jgi:hypothetical protein